MVGGLGTLVAHGDVVVDLGAELVITKVGADVEGGAVEIRWTLVNDGDSTSGGYVDDLEIAPVASCDAIDGAKPEKAVLSKEIQEGALDPDQSVDQKVVTHLTKGVYDVSVVSRETDAPSDSAAADTCLVVGQ
jgi:hypothetical protein